MAVVDWVIIGILVLSSLISLTRGFVREALSLFVWVAAFVVARMYSGNLATLLADYISTGSVRWVVAFVILFLGTIAIGGMLTYLISELVRVTGLGSTDRVLGMVFGLVRGLVLLVAIVYGLKLTMVPEDPWWKESLIIPHLELLADWVRDTLPGAGRQVMSSLPTDF